MDMDWTQAVTIIGTNLAVIFGFVIFLLGRMDSNKRDTDHKIESAQKDNNAKFDRVLDLMDANQKENNAKFEKMLGLIDSNQKENNIKFEAINGKFDAVNTRFNGLENRLTSMESEIKNVNQNLGQRIESTNQRIDNTNQRITDLKTDMNQRLSTIEGYLVPKKVFHFEEPDHKEDPEEPKEN